MADAHTEAIHVHKQPTSFIWKYVFSLDHKVIGKQYYFLALFSVFVGLCLSILMRWHLVWPDAHIPGLHWLSAAGAPNDKMTPEYYLSLMTMHATLMVFFVLTTAPQSGFGNYFLPIQIGAEDMAFPRLNMLSFWTTFVALMVLVSSFFVTDGPPLSMRAVKALRAGIVWVNHMQPTYVEAPWGGFKMLLSLSEVTFKTLLVREKT